MLAQVPDDSAIDDILDYWIGDGQGPRNHLWFGGGAQVDADIRVRFGPLLEPARAGEVDSWADTARGRLALIIVLDQFGRNLHRDSARAYDGDTKAQALCVDGMARGYDRQLGLFERWFFYMPLEHAEDIALQQRSVRCFERLLEEAPEDQRSVFETGVDFARRHRDVIARFGRFPHRNDLLDRPSTPEEKHHLAAGDWF